MDYFKGIGAGRKSGRAGVSPNSAGLAGADRAGSRRRQQQEQQQRVWAVGSDSLLDRAVRVQMGSWRAGEGSDEESGASGGRVGRVGFMGSLEESFQEQDEEMRQVELY